MRVIGGKLKGRVLKGPQNIRPVTSFIKEAIFNVLQGIDWQCTSVLDVFTGAGNFGIEALSRGAAKVVFVDISRESRKYILQNLEGVSWKGGIYIGDVRLVVKKLFQKGEKFNIIFADPPFDHGFGMELPRLFESNFILEKDGLVIIRLRDKEKLSLSSFWDAEVRKYGDSAVYFLKRRGGED